MRRVNCFLACFEQNDLLLGQAMECAGMIGEAVGRTRFKSDGLAMMSTLMVRISSTDLYKASHNLAILLASCSVL